MKKFIQLKANIKKEKILCLIEEKAKEFCKKTEFLRLFNSYSKEKKKSIPEIQRYEEYSTNGLTSFIGGDYQDYKSGMWIANENGINIFLGMTQVEACSHPIMPIQILINAETGFCKVKIAFKLKRKWKEIIVDKETVSSASKITSLSKFGIRVTSENAKLLVRYLSDMEAMNEDFITEQVSTSKLGWINDEFMPYEKNIVFDNESGLKNIFDSIGSFGDREKWYDVVKKIRSEGKMETKNIFSKQFCKCFIRFCERIAIYCKFTWNNRKGKNCIFNVSG